MTYHIYCSGPYLQVPTLEHNGKIIGESLDLIKYVDSNFEGPSLSPDVRKYKKMSDYLCLWKSFYLGRFEAVILCEQVLSITSAGNNRTP